MNGGRGTRGLCPLPPLPITPRGALMIWPVTPRCEESFRLVTELHHVRLAIETAELKSPLKSLNTVQTVLASAETILGESEPGFALQFEI